MISDPLVLYKLMVLYMLQQANLPMTNGQLAEFFLSREYAGYMPLQQSVSELLDAHLIKEEKKHTGTRYLLTPEGKETLGFFGKDISEAVREDIHTFLRENSLRLRNEMGITGDYHKGSGGEYEVELEIREARSLLMKLTVTVPAEEQARLMCERFQSVSQEIYSSVMLELLKNN